MFKGILTASKAVMTKKDHSSDFSKFFREASSREKKEVFLDVAKKASKEQLEVFKQLIRS